jgi:hemerythrin-like metal-binding protein
MDYPEWMARYGVGNASLDSCHPIFFQAVEQMDQAATMSNMGAALERMVFLLMYCAMHFGEEESILYRAGYPALAQHRAIHQRFQRRMTILHEELEKNPSPSLAAQTAIETREWWINHILGEDMKYAPYLPAQE